MTKRPNNLDGLQAIVGRTAEDQKRIELEKHIAAALVVTLLNEGWRISVSDGEQYVLRRSVNMAAIIEAMMTTDCDILLLREANDDLVGTVTLIYGNGEDVISNWSDDPRITAVVNRVWTHCGVER